MIKLIKTWKQDASSEFSRIMARYIAIKCKVNSVGWEDVKNRLVKDVALIITDISEEMVVIAGNRAAVDNAEKEVRECMEKAMKQSEREKQSIEISVSVIPGKYAVLHTTDVIVNSVGTDLSFGVGLLCKALLEKAGQVLQVEFENAKQRQVAGPGSVLCTSGYDLACKFVFHAIMPIGSITLQVISGDITKEDTEVIVNISNPTFNATSGIEYVSQKGFITTQGGKLLCSKIIHLIHNNNVKSQVSKVLNECELRMYKSVAFPAIGTELPAQWEDMEKERIKLVNLKPSCQEYLDVQDKFKKTCHSFVIEKIERIQNPFLWQTYQIKKTSLCTKNTNQSNEKLLFHGTAASSLSTINYSGFNRGFAGKNAAVIGNGTYFAVDASYSAQDTYSVPDMNGRRYMYLARVLTGQYCAGRKGLITPPPKNPADPTDLYDSVVDDVNNPTMFVIFNDIQAYPQYLITFKK
uniref:Poly [ADP-ribose] polymerase n=1 Tax=Strix occidentalis caurina TaxID=311401 RepID=A0A8D0FE88_STROC